MNTMLIFIITCNSGDYKIWQIFAIYHTKTGEKQNVATHKRHKNDKMKVF